MKIQSDLNIDGNVSVRGTNATITSAGNAVFQSVSATSISGVDIYDSNFTGTLVLISNANKSIGESSITTTKLNYLSTTSADIQTQLNSKEPLITAGTTNQYRRGDNTWQTLNTSIVPELTNLYYTQARFDTAFGAKTTTNLVEGTNLYYTNARVKTYADTLYLPTSGIDASKIISGTIDVARIPVLPSQVPQVTTNLASLTTTQQNIITSGTVVTTSDDGWRYVYIGTGSKTSSASYVQLADISPSWETIANRPTLISTWTNDVGYLTPSSSLDPSKVSQSASYRFVTDTEKATWNGKQTSSSILTSISTLSSGIGLLTLTNGVASLDSNSYALTTSLNNYLPLSGGTMSGHLLGSTSYNIGATANWWGSGFFTTLNVQNNPVWHSGNFIPGNYVDIPNTQTITGTKTFTNNVNIGKGGANTTNYSLLSFDTERPWRFTKFGSGGSTQLHLIETSGNKTFVVGYSNDSTSATHRVLEIGTHNAAGSGSFVNINGTLTLGGSLSVAGSLTRNGYFVWDSSNLIGDQTGHYHNSDRAWSNISGVPANVQNPQNYYLPLTGGTLTGELSLAASTTTYASMNIPTRASALTTPVLGDIWSTGTQFTTQGLGFKSVLSASDVVGTGAHLYLEGIGKAWIAQVGTSNSLDFWNYNGGWFKKIQFFSDGSATFSGNVSAPKFIVNGKTNVDVLLGDGNTTTLSGLSSSHNHDSVYLKLAGGALNNGANITSIRGLYFDQSPDYGSANIIKGNGDNATQTMQTLKIRSWYGIGFDDMSPTTPITRTWFNVRTGNNYTVGNWYADTDKAVWHSGNFDKSQYQTIANMAGYATLAGTNTWTGSNTFTSNAVFYNDVSATTFTSKSGLYAGTLLGQFGYIGSTPHQTCYNDLSTLNGMSFSTDRCKINSTGEITIKVPNYIEYVNPSTGISFYGGSFLIANFNNSSITMMHKTTFHSNIVPNNTNYQYIGDDVYRWKNIYTNDIHTTSINYNPSIFNSNSTITLVCGYNEIVADTGQTIIGDLPSDAIPGDVLIIKGKDSSSPYTTNIRDPLRSIKERNGTILVSANTTYSLTGTITFIKTNLGPWQEI